MIARRTPARKRRCEVLERLARVAGTSGRLRAPQRGRVAHDGEGAEVERLARALADLGPVFAAYGLYLADRGDLLAPAHRRCLAAVDRAVPPLPPPVVRAIVRAESGRTRAGAGPSGPPSDTIAALDAEPFDTRLLVQRHRGRLSSGRPVVIRVVRPERSIESDLELVPLLRDVIVPLLGDGRLFAQSVDDFRASYAAQTNGCALADCLEVLRHDARGWDSLKIPEVHREISTPRVLVLEHLPGRRLAAMRGGAAQPAPAGGESVQGEGDDEPRGRRRVGDGLARLVCEIWLRQAFDGGLVPTEFRPEDLIVLGRARVAIDEGTFIVLPDQTRKNLLKYLVAVAIDEPRKALDCLLKEFEATRHCTPIDELDRLFRQMVPDADRDEPSDGPPGRLAATMMAQWRLAIANGYRPLRPVLPLLRGVVRLSETVGVLAPGRDALLDGLKDYRIARLLGDVQALFEPMYWFSRIDRLAGVMISSPRILDDALAAAVPDRAAEERRAPGPRERHSSAGRWIIPALAALAMVGLAHGRGPPVAGGSRDEWLAAVLFLLLGCWLLHNVGDSYR